MVEIVFEPWKKIVIHEIVQCDFRMLTNLHTLGVQPGQLGRPMNWANGVAFEQSVMPATEEVVKEQIEGKIHWSYLMFAFLPNYQQVVVIPEGNIKIPIIDLSSNPLFKDIAEWIKQRFRAK